MIATALFTHRYFPARRPGPEEKLMVFLHGLGDSLDGFTWMPSEMGLDNLSYLLVNAPDEYYGGFSWFDFMGDKAVAAKGMLRSRGLLAGLLGELVEQGVKPGNLLLGGFSQGCLMALDAGLRTGLRLGGICGISGWLAFQEEYPAAFSPMAREQKFLLTHGTRDPVLPYAVTKVQAEFLVAQGIDLEFRTYDKDHTILPGELADIRKWLRERL